MAATAARTPRRPSQLSSSCANAGTLAWSSSPHPSRRTPTLRKPRSRRSVRTNSRTSGPTTRSCSSSRPHGAPGAMQRSSRSLRTRAWTPSSSASASRRAGTARMWSGSAPRAAQWASTARPRSSSTGGRSWAPSRSGRSHKLSQRHFDAPVHAVGLPEFGVRDEEVLGDNLEDRILLLGDADGLEDLEVVDDDLWVFARGQDARLAGGLDTFAGARGLSRIVDGECDVRVLLDVLSVERIRRGDEVEVVLL